MRIFFANSIRASDATALQRAADLQKYVEDCLNVLSDLQSHDTAKPSREISSGAPEPRSSELILSVKTASELAAFQQQLHEPCATSNAPIMAETTTLNRIVTLTSSAEQIPQSFYHISVEELIFEVIQWKEVKSLLPQGKAAPLPALNLKQGNFARKHFQVQTILAEGRGSNASPVDTHRRLKQLGLSYIDLLHGPAGVGKSVLLAVMQQELLRYNLGLMFITAWTGIASAPFGTQTLCSLLKLDSKKLDTDRPMTEDQISAVQADFAKIYCEPKDLLVLVIDAISFVVSSVLHHLDIQLQRLCAVYNVPFGGVSLILAGDFHEKSPPQAISLERHYINASQDLQFSLAMCSQPNCWPIVVWVSCIL